ncbi:MAG TPA: Crp/Fnr family transcriptional regulator [Gemmatimonadaceae bacterium]|nr:Crp/Fnr family transcriptional regulator [Gemmatimonadaceae bacterium]
MITVEQLRSSMPALDELPDATIARIVRGGQERRYAKGATLFRAGDPAHALYLILSGRVHVTRERTSSSAFLHTEGAGGVLGEIPVFGGGPFPATARAAAPTQCLYVPATVVERLLRDDSAFARCALRRLAARALSLLGRIDELTATTITARVADYLLTRAESLGDDFTLGMSQEALARELGTAREVVVRAIRSLVGAGAIARTGRSRFIVKEPAVLRAIAAR